MAVVPVADAARLAALAALVGQVVDVAPLRATDGGVRGCVATPRSQDGESGDASDGDALGAALSRAVPAAPVLLLRTDRAAGDASGDASEGSVRVEQWSRGSREPGADVERSPGLVLDSLPRDVERVVHGVTTVGALPGATTSAGTSRLAAARAVAGRRGAAPSTGLLGPVLLGLLAAALLVLEALQVADGAGSWVVMAVAVVVLGWSTASLVARRRSRRERAGRP